MTIQHFSLPNTSLPRNKSLWPLLWIILVPSLVYLGTVFPPVTSVLHSGQSGLSWSPCREGRMQQSIFSAPCFSPSLNLNLSKTYLSVSAYSTYKHMEVLKPEALHRVVFSGGSRWFFSFMLTKWIYCSEENFKELVLWPVFRGLCWWEQGTFRSPMPFFLTK